LADFSGVFSVAIARFFHIFSVPYVLEERKNQFCIVTYSVIETGGKQYRVVTGDKLRVERLPAEAGQSVVFDRVLLVNQDGKVTVGAPTVASASVVADVVGHIRGPKLITFKMKRRKGYHKKIGHRQELTVVTIKEIKA
jgi:large subunit ribosomal protein L21